MKTMWIEPCGKSILDVAVVAGMLALFAAIAVPLVRGAIIRRQTAECARKIIQAADAFDLYAALFGNYPHSQYSTEETETVMRGAFATCDIDWWSAAAEPGGAWSWYSNGRTSSVVIAGTDISDAKMVQLDRLLDDGNLETGSFQRHCSRYHYILRRECVL